MKHNTTEYKRCFSISLFIFFLFISRFGFILYESVFHTGKIYMYVKTEICHVCHYHVEAYHSIYTKTGFTKVYHISPYTILKCDFTN